MGRRLLVAVIGGHECDSRVAALAEGIGAVVAQAGAVLVCGGLGGIMEAAARGAKNSDGYTVGIIPGEDKSSANKFIDIVITTGMGFSRNVIVAGTADLIVALPGEYGTLSEIGFALNAKKPVYGLGTWDIPGVEKLVSPEELKDIIREHIRGMK
ncbi:TIGR00725 family protein [Candidatus Omnitrophota bacterium]